MKRQPTKYETSLRLCSLIRCMLYLPGFLEGSIAIQPPTTAVTDTNPTFAVHFDTSQRTRKDALHPGHIPPCARRSRLVRCRGAFMRRTEEKTRAKAHQPPHFHRRCTRRGCRRLRPVDHSSRHGPI